MDSENDSMNIIFPCSTLGRKNQNGTCDCLFADRMVFNGKQCVCKNGLSGLLCDTHICLLEKIKICKKTGSTWLKCGQNENMFLLVNPPPCNCSSMNYSETYNRLNQVCKFKSSPTVHPKSDWGNNYYVGDRYNKSFPTDMSDHSNGNSPSNKNTIGVTVLLPILVFFVCMLVSYRKKILHRIRRHRIPTTFVDVTHAAPPLPSNAAGYSIGAPGEHHQLPYDENYPFLPNYDNITAPRPYGITGQPELDFRGTPYLSNRNLTPYAGNDDAPPLLYDNIPQTPPPSYEESTSQKASKGNVHVVG